MKLKRNIINQPKEARDEGIGEKEALRPQDCSDSESQSFWNKIDDENEVILKVRLI